MTTASRAMKPLPAEDLRRAFNQAADAVRLLAVVSPTCPLCLAGYAALRSLLDCFPAAPLQAFVVWIPMLPEDDAEAAAEAAVPEDPRRLLQGWDAGRRIGNLFEQSLALTRTAWDVYLVYAPGVVWEGDLPPAPSFWMHQLDLDSGAAPALWLDPAALAREVGRLLRPAG